MIKPIAAIFISIALIASCSARSAHTCPAPTPSPAPHTYTLDEISHLPYDLYPCEGRDFAAPCIQYTLTDRYFIDDQSVMHLFVD